MTSGPETAMPDHLHAGGSRLDQRAHDLGNGKLARIGFLQADAAGVEQDQYRDRLEFLRRAQQSRQLGAVHLTEGAAHEAAFLRRYEYRRTVETTVTNHDSVVELLGKVEHPQMRADLAHLRSDELQERSGVEQQLDPCSR
jgi:hypothetical protein